MNTDRATPQDGSRWSGHDWLVCVVVGVLAVMVRGLTLGQNSLWVDELAQVLTYYSDSYKVVMYQAAKHGQPPLDYWIGYVVFKFFRSDIAARLPALCFGTLGVLGSFVLARRLVGTAYASLVAVALACSPFAIHYSQEARPYALCWAALVFAVCLLHRAWQRNLWHDWCAFAAVWFVCQMSRSLGPLMISAGLGVYGLYAVYRRLRRDGGHSPMAVLRLRGVRLLLCLTAVWIPFLYLFQFILYKTRKGSYLVGSSSELFNWTDNIAVLRMGLQALWHCTLPAGWVVVPLGIVGTAVCLYGRAGSKGIRHGMIFVPLAIGYLLHVAVYTVVVGGTLPKLAYWGYVQPFLYLGTAWALSEMVNRWVVGRLPRRVLQVGWCVLVVLLVLPLRIDRSQALVCKPDWRGALAAVGGTLDHRRDVVFCAEAQLYGTGGMVFRVSPHYWETADHLVNVLRDGERVYNDGRPILDRRDCRVGLLLKCHPHQEPTDLHRRLSSASRAAFEVQGFQNFCTLTSRDRYATADDGLIALAGVVEEVLADRPDLAVYVRIGLMRVLSKQGRDGDAAAVLARARSAVDPAHRSGFDQVCADYTSYVRTRRVQAAHLTAWPAPTDEPALSEPEPR